MRTAAMRPWVSMAFPLSGRQAMPFGPLDVARAPENRAPHTFHCAHSAPLHARETLLPLVAERTAGFGFATV